MNFQGNHILSIQPFTQSAVGKIFRIADEMEPYAKRERITTVLDGAILGNMFFESSTRTRISFGCAFNLLGGHVRETTGVQTSAIAKGESLYDTARVLSGYSDIIVMRHPMDGSVAEFAQASRVPVINGGDGANEHPSQALLDLYTIKKELASHTVSIDNMQITLIGDLKHGRTVHSLCKLLKLYKNIQFTLVSPIALQMPPAIVSELKASGHTVLETDQLEHGLYATDIIYLTRIQEERFPSPTEANKYRGQFRLNQQIYTRNCKPNTVIMHPLPRDSRSEANELDNDLNQHPNLAIFRQTDNGVLIRMALFALILGVENQVHQYARDINWHSKRDY